MNKEIMKRFFSILMLGIVLLLANAAMPANGVIVLPLGDDLYVLRSPSCCRSDVTFCTTASSCTAAGGNWWSDNTCLAVPESETVISAGGRIWMDRNLGASRVATSPTDSAAFGDLYQWGRDAEGHQLRTSGITAVTSSTDNPGHGSFISNSSSPYDWRVPQNDLLWQGANSINNPCPAGFKLPSKDEWEAERTSWSSNDGDGAFASPLKIVLAGYRDSGGVPDNDGTVGSYWSSTVAESLANYLYIVSNYSDTIPGVRAAGFSVRCIKD